MSTVSLEIVNPVATPQALTPDAVHHPAARRPGTLEGKTVALYWNGKQNGPAALTRTRELLSERFSGVRFVEVIGELGGTNRYLSPDQLRMLAESADAVVATPADCGSCCSWLMRDLCELERRGVPAVGYTAEIFDEDARFSIETFGVPDACPVLVPDCFSNKSTEQIEKMVDNAFPVVIECLTTDRPSREQLPIYENMVLESAPALHFDGADLLEAFDEMQRQFVRNKWSDGLPLIPPTRAKVNAMIATSGHEDDDMVGLFAPGFGVGTVEKIAANAVMAGCRPEAMPVVLVSGPIADEIGMNHGVCALGPGSVSEVNVAIGRALRLIMMNIGLSYPGISDMDTIGTSMKFSACVAENEQRTPWDPWRVQQGFGLNESTVTVNVPYGMTEFFDFQNHDPERLVETWATLTSQACGTPSAGAWLIKKDAPLEAGYPFHGKFSNLLLMAPDHADAFAGAGWTPEDIRQAIHKATVLPFAKLMLNQSPDAFVASHPELLWLLDAPETLVTVNPSPECFEFFVVGASAGRSQFCFGGTNSVTKAVTASTA
jgi:hypothetical protein